MDLVLQSEIKPGTIQNNLDAFVKEVQKEAAKYQGLIFADEDIKSAKKTVADLRKYRSDIETRRKKVKADWIKPYTAFENEIKRALVFIDDVIKPITVQIDEAEEKRRTEKLDTIIEMKSKMLEESPAAHFIDAPWFDDPRWLNVSVSLKKVEESILEKKEQIEKDLAVIRSNGGEYTERLLEEYRANGDISDTMAFKEALIQEAQRAQKLREELERRKAEAAAKSQEQEQAPPSERVASPQAADTSQEPAERTLTITFSATGTISQLKALRAFCDKEGIVIDRA